MGSIFTNKRIESQLILGAETKADQDKDTKNIRVETLEHSDTEESYRQLKWTIGVTVLGLAIVAYFNL